jgi:hypothetical protein
MQFKGGSNQKHKQKFKVEITKKIKEITEDKNQF